MKLLLKRDIARLGIVGDVFEIVPALTEQLREHGAQPISR